MRSFFELVRRDLQLARRDGAALGTVLGFYVIVATMLPLGVGPDLNLTSRIAPAVLWVGLLLAALLSLGRIFEGDAEDGAVDVLAAGPLPLELVAAAKSLAHWISTALPLAVLSPLLAILLNLDAAAYPMLIAGTLLGTPAVSFIGSIGAALTLRARRGGLLVALLILPLYVPTLIFGIAVVSAAAALASPWPALLILAAISLASVALAPFAAAAALRAQLQ